MNAHFVGIGGIGMSALARYFVSRGVSVSGSDEGTSSLLDELASEGIEIYQKHDANLIHSGMYQIVYSEAIPQNNPERQRAKELDIPQKSYFSALGDIAKTKHTISICGTHGKSTTTAMAGLALEAAFQDPLVILGTKVFEWGNKNIRLPATDGAICMPKGSGLFLVESCEYHNSFLHLEPHIIIVTNIEPDHLDFFGTAENYYKAFQSFADKMTPGGALIANFSDPFISALFLHCKAQKINTSDFITEVPEMMIPGKHNTENAACVLALASIIGAPTEKIKESLAQFNGTWRRFEKKGERDGVIVYDDYAHHPTEIKATLNSFREKFPKQKIWAIFQPHQYSRTREFLQGFSESFNKADEVLIPNICRVRDTDEDVASINAEKLVEEIKKHNSHVRHTHDFPKTIAILKDEVQSGDIVVSIGAGPVNEVSEWFLNN